MIHDSLSIFKCPLALPEMQEYDVAMFLTEFAPKATSSASVLVIDDDEADLQHWSDTVRNLGRKYTVLEAHDCKSGLAICRDRIAGLAHDGGQLDVR